MSRYYYLKLLLRSSLLLEPDEYALDDIAHYGLVCSLKDMRLSSAFQPVYRADGKTVGYEALLRPVHLEHGNVLPEAAFVAAQQERRLVQFDRLVRVIHLLNHVRSLPDDNILFLNVHSELVASVGDHGRTFEQVLHYYSVPTSRVVIEIRDSDIGDECLMRATENYRSLGYRIAIDGLAATPKSIKRVIELRPDFMKIDSAQLIESDAPEQLVACLHKAGIRVIAQRIETDDHLKVAREAGADLLQGYRLGRPAFVDDRYRSSTPLAA